MNVMVMLMRREFWEHRALWVAPLVVPALAVLFTTFGPINIHLPYPTSQQERINLAGVMHMSVASFQYVVAMIVLFFYLLDCLFTERRDRSILFWKSLPVSDSATVLSKLIVALIIVPVFVYVVVFATHLVCSGIAWLRGGFDQQSFLAFDLGTTIQVQVLLLTSLLVAVLWYTPVAGYLLLVSVLARRSAFLWAVLPPLVLSIGERVMFRSSYIGEFLGYRLVGWPSLLTDQGSGVTTITPFEQRRERIASIERIFENMDLGSALTNIDVWLGVIVAAALVYAAIRIRARKDDT